MLLRKLFKTCCKHFLIGYINFASLHYSVFLSLFFLCNAKASAQLKEKEYTVEKFADGVYGFIWKGLLENPIEANSLFVINEHDVLVVDACLFPSSTRTMIKELKKLTSNPVRYVITTHWHDDHHNGNFVYKEVWPEVEFIAHYNTHFDVLEQVIKTRPSVTKNFHTQHEFYSKWLKEGKDNKGIALTPERRSRVLGLVELYQKNIDEIEPLKTIVPTLVFSDSLVLHRGERIIKILWLGRANTKGDAIIYLPKEGIAAVGDLIVSPIPFAFGSYYKEWVHTLDKIDSLNATVLLPGHGFPYRDRNYLRQVRGLLAALVNDVDSAVQKGLSLEETKKTILLTDWKNKFSGGDPVKERSFDLWFITPAVERAWHQAKGNKEGT